MENHKGDLKVKFIPIVSQLKVLIFVQVLEHNPHCSISVVNSEATCTEIGAFINGYMRIDVGL